MLNQDALFTLADDRCNVQSSQKNPKDPKTSKHRQRQASNRDGILLATLDLHYLPTTQPTLNDWLPTASL